MKVAQIKWRHQFHEQFRLSAAGYGRPLAATGIPGGHHACR